MVNILLSYAFSEHFDQQSNQFEQNIIAKICLKWRLDTQFDIKMNLTMAITSTYVNSFNSNIFLYEDFFKSLIQTYLTSCFFGFSWQNAKMQHEKQENATRNNYVWHWIAYSLMYNTGNWCFKNIFFLQNYVDFFLLFLQANQFLINRSTDQLWSLLNGLVGEIRLYKYFPTYID